MFVDRLLRADARATHPILLGSDGAGWRPTLAVAVIVGD
jgi:hypothetical protein